MVRLIKLCSPCTKSKLRIRNQKSERCCSTWNIFQTAEDIIARARSVEPVRIRQNMQDKRSSLTNQYYPESTNCLADARRRRRLDGQTWVYVCVCIPACDIFIGNCISCRVREEKAGGARASKNRAVAAAFRVPRRLVARI